jgi:ABC-2 type transport system ATP-binding protein
MTMLLEIEGLTKRYGKGRAPANDGISVGVERGQVFGLLGHNGAGKTTLVNQIVGLLRPDAGSIRIDGHDVVADPAMARRLCALQPQAQVPIRGLTPRQAIELIGQMRGATAGEVGRREAELVEGLRLGEWMDMDAARLSGGVKRLVSFCMTAVAPGRLAVLDEPTNDVDPVRRRLLWQQVRALADGGVAVLLVTHNVLEAERSVDRLAVLDHGKVLAAGTPAAIKSGIVDGLRLEITLEPQALLPPIPGFLRPISSDGARVVAGLAGPDAGGALAWAQRLQADGLLEEFSLAPSTLEDAYLALVGSDGSTSLPHLDDPLHVSRPEEALDVRAA